MFDGWENYYLMVGSSAGALIGLMFVVVTLTAGRDHAEVERGKHLYTSPIVWHLAVVMTLSAGAAAPTLTPHLFAIASGGLALLGAAVCIRNAVSIARAALVADTVGFDTFWYGIAPAIVYLGMGGAAYGVLRGAAWGASAVAAALLALLLVSIHAEWDLVTYLAPIAGRSSDDKKR